MRNRIFGVTLRLLVIHFVVTPAINKLRRLQSTSVINSLWSVSVLHLPYLRYLPLERFIARDGARYWLRIAMSAYPTCIQRHRYGGGEGFRRNIAMAFGKEKLKRCDCPNVNKI